MNHLIFRTPPGNAIIVDGTTLNIATIDVSKFERIRIIATQGGGSGPVIVRLTILDGNERVGPLDQFVLGTSSLITRVYEVPGVKLSLDLDASANKAQGQDGVIVLIYGWDLTQPAQATFKLPNELKEHQ